MIHHLIHLMVYITAISESSVVGHKPQLEIDDCKVELLNNRENTSKVESSILHHLLYKIVGLNRTFILNIHMDDKFLSVRFLSQRLSGDRAWLIRHGSLPNCFYTGFVNQSFERTVSVSLCNGMLGTFYSEGTNYFVEPVHDNSTTNIVGHRLTRQKPSQNSPFLSHQCQVLDQVVMSEKKNFSNTIRRRVRRDMTRPFYLEVMVVTDYSMYQFHEDDLKVYVLTLMAAAANLYRQASIGVAIEVSLVRHYMIQDPDSPPEITNNALETLHNFCNWQSSLNVKDNHNPLHYDAAVLLTRKDLCRERCNTLGVAELNGLCSLSTSCAVIEDNGLATGFTIAHELAHLFGVRHDGDKLCVERGLTETNLMATSLTFAHNHWQWSDCSRHFFNAKLQSADLWCLRNKPSNAQQIVNGDQAHMMQYPPGFYYPVNDQCEKAFGMGYTYCPFQSQPFCKYLFCCRSDQNGTFCATNHATVADGTPCTDSTSPHSLCSTSRCLHGDCVCWYDRAPIEGKWGPWGPYGQCSRTCGGGIQKRYRECNNPTPANGGRFCVGNNVGIRTCNLEKCPPRYIEYRQMQCSKYNGQTFGHADLPRNVRWVPKYEVMENERCKLICQVQDDRKERSVVISDAVEDGTKCGPEDETTDLCISGQCIRIGCDNVYDSESIVEIKMADMCGVCGGNNDTCEKISKRIIKDDYGFQLVASIPIGATNIEIKQVSARRGQKDKNYLVLKDASGQDGIINSEQSFSTRRRIIKYKSTPFEYTGTDTHIERINATKRLRTPVSLFVMKADVARMIIDIEYWIESRTRRIFRWVQDVETSYTPACSRICNGVRHAKQYVCKDGYQTVLDERCDPSAKPEVVDEPCNTDCYVSWVQLSYTPCSSRCGHGFKDARFACRLDEKTNKTYRLIENSHCIELVGPEPSMSVPCDGDCTESGWMFSPWSNCKLRSRRCVRTRNATCLDERGIEAHESLCIVRYKTTREACKMSECEQGTWSIGEWDKCDCLNGFQYRVVKCTSSTAKSLPRNRCPNLKPIGYKSCSQSCVKAKWSSGEWTECPKSCGLSWRKREIYCVLDNRIVDAYQCSGTPKPVDIDLCVQPICRSWKLGTWSKCHCANNTRVRDIWCERSDGKHVADYLCDLIDKPVTFLKCKCEKARWITRKWSQCSTPCGPGVRRRKVICFIGKRQVPVQYCRLINRPKDTELCSNRPCVVDWQTGKWGECSKLCGNGTQSRLLNCVREGSSVSDQICSHLPRPKTDQPCIGNRCAAWIAGRWSDCSVKCGKGIQVRNVHCSHLIDCDLAKRPVGARKCSGRDCKYEWTIGSWSQCKGECGKMGSKTRTVSCVEASHKTTTSAYKCPGNRPASREECNLTDCGHWFTGGWSKCSVVCGQGIKRRHVYCLSENGHSSNSCAMDTKPAQIQPCTGFDCDIPKWKSGPFQHCNQTCGRRSVWCSVAEEKCKLADRPIEVKPCTVTCGARLRYGPWQPCREVNGRCLRTRDAICVDESGAITNGCNEKAGRIKGLCKCGRWKIIGNLTCLCKNYTRNHQLQCILPQSNKVTAQSNCKQIRSLRSTLPQCPPALCKLD
ncbi:hypothetical protein ACOME3_004694 [Neoechinorhynchus agilis]